MRLEWIAACFVAAFLAPAAFGQSMQKDLKAVAVHEDFNGAAQFAEEGLLHQGKSGTRSFKVAAGETYLAAGLCDVQCGSLGLRVMDAAGAIITESASASDKPALSFTPKVSGTITIGIAMAKCFEKDGCEYGIGVFAAGAQKAVSAKRLDAMRELTDERAAPYGYKRVGEVTVGAMAAGGSVKVSYALDPAKGYAVFAQCEDDCLDINMTGRDAAGAVVKKDSAKDSSPVLIVDPGKSGASLSVDLDMVTCETRRCAYGVAIYTK
jgi:hypothetical protein